MVLHVGEKKVYLQCQNCKYTVKRKSQVEKQEQRQLRYDLRIRK